MLDLPKFHEFMTPLLQVLKENGVMYRQDAIDAVIRREGLTEEQLAVAQESNGKSVVRGRIAWASSYLKQAGALTYPRRAHFALGPNADQLLALGRPATLPDIRALPEYKAHQAAKAEIAAAAAEEETGAALSDSTPEDLIEKGFAELRKQLVADLLDNIKNIPPAAFEKLVLQVLAAMGYGGGDAQSIQGVPRGPDGGIDGKINEDKLGLDQIYVQAKRYSDNSVGRPTVQSFVGAMTGGGCKKGVFVTTSAFTQDARSFAAGLRDQRLVLIDGAAFAKLMVEYGIGVQVKETYRVARIDQDFFSGDD